jgi:hypothetical protein
MKALLVAAALVLAVQPEVAGAAEATFQIQVLLARQESGERDRRIPDSLLSYLEGSFGARYRSFAFLDDASVQVSPGKPGAVRMPDGSSLLLTFRETQGEFLVLDMQLKDLRATVRIRDGGLFFQAGHRYLDGMLIVAITGRLKSAPSGSGKPGNARPPVRSDGSADPVPQGRRPIGAPVKPGSR